MLYERLHELACVAGRGPTFIRDDGSVTSLSFAQLVGRARHVQARLQAHGLRKGDRLGLIISDGEQCITTFLGAVMAGVIPIVLPVPPVVGDGRGYTDLVRRIAAVARSSRLVVSRGDVSRVPSLPSAEDAPAAGEAVLTVEDLLDEPAGEPDEPLLTPEDICFLQFTSGSSADPKGVVVTHRNVAANARAMLADTLRVDPTKDVGVCWLPLYHDMGLVGNVLAALLYEIPVVYLPTKSFIRHPNIWMKTISEYRGTITFAPNFAFALAARRASAEFVASLDLRCVRVLGCGGETINPAVMQAFQNVFSVAGLDPNAMMPCYGMAEATLAISFDRLDRPPRVLHIDRDAYEQHSTARLAWSGASDALEVVSCGRTFPEHQVRVVSADGARLPDGRVGEIVFGGPSVSRGYFEDAQETRAAIRDGWLFTGDVGFLHGGELFVTGRSKDRIIVNGRNFHPQDFEWLVEQHAAIRSGASAAFGLRDESTERVVVVAEAKPADGLDRVRMEIREEVLRSLGVSLTDVVLVRPGSLPKTTSGKIRRRETKVEYQQGRLSRYPDLRTRDTCADRVYRPLERRAR
jgi:fatty-acyl-CoA synthase